jgi:hypothetical protein
LPEKHLDPIDIPFTPDSLPTEQSGSSVTITGENGQSSLPLNYLERRRLAKFLYTTTDMRVVEISEFCHVNVSLLYRWIRENNWKGQKNMALEGVDSIRFRTQTALAKEIEASNYDAIPALMDVLKTFAPKQWKAVEVRDVLRSLIEFIAISNPELSKGAAQYADMYLRERFS